ncbi:MAG TPA: hypothetical protein VH702_08815 [Vicinamibacterales bacterium]|jgi:hypothetical protein
MMKISFAIVLIVAAFLAGVAVAQTQDEPLVVRATVRDANTIPERIEYWELSLSDGSGSLTIVGPKELPIVSWLRRMKGRPVMVSVQRDVAK